MLCKLIFRTGAGPAGAERIGPPCFPHESVLFDILIVDKSVENVDNYLKNNYFFSLCYPFRYRSIGASGFIFPRFSAVLITNLSIILKSYKFDIYSGNKI